MGNCYWRGGAPATYDIWTLTLANTWAANDIARVTIGTKDLLLTVGSSTKSAIATELIATINAATFNSPAPPTGFSRNVGGQQIPEFTEISAAAHPTDAEKIVITARSPGAPIGLTAGETTAGDGTLTASNTTVASGPNFLDNADNYLAGALPVDNDVLYFDAGAVDALYGLTYFRTNSIDLDIHISNDWTGQLGLPAYNAIGGYSEYRQRYFQFRGASKTIYFEAGVSGSLSQRNCWIDLQDNSNAIVISNVVRGAGGSASVFLAGAPSGSSLGAIKIAKGIVEIEPDDAPTDSSKYFRCGPIKVGVSGGSQSEARVTIGRNARLHLSGDLEVYSGSVVTLAAPKVSTDECDCFVYGGSLTVCPPSGGSASLVQVYDGGTLYPAGPGTVTYTEVEAFGGTIDFRPGQVDQTITSLKLYAGSSIFDPDALLSSASANLVGCRLSQITHDLPPNVLLDWSVAATP